MCVHILATKCGQCGHCTSRCCSGCSASVGKISAPSSRDSDRTKDVIKDRQPITPEERKKGKKK